MLLEKQKLFRSKIKIFNEIFFILIIFIIFLIFIIVRDYQIKKKKFKLNNALNSNFFIQTINNLIEENKYNLLEERIRLREIDAYGNEDYKKWIGNPPLDEKAIGNKAVQEISAGKLFWKGTHAIIVSKSVFTKSAHKLAKSNKVELINEYQLKDLEKFIV